MSKVKKYNPDEVFFTSDLHLNHSNIIHHCDRPFKDSSEMDAEIIRRWNEKIPPTAHVFLLGDVCYGKLSIWENYIKQLNGTIHLIKGNHDYQQGIKLEGLFNSIHDQLEIIINDGNTKQSILLNHYPLLTWAKYERGAWNLYGHYHTSKTHKLEGTSPKQYDVGVDNNNFTPISYYEVKDIIQKQIAETSRYWLTKDDFGVMFWKSITKPEINSPYRIYDLEDNSKAVCITDTLYSPLLLKVASQFLYYNPTYISESDLSPSGMLTETIREVCAPIFDSNGNLIIKDKHNEEGESNGSI